MTAADSPRGFDEPVSLTQDNREYLAGLITIAAGDTLVAVVDGTECQFNPKEGTAP